jgi:hypothetical protein
MNLRPDDGTALRGSPFDFGFTGTIPAVIAGCFVAIFSRRGVVGPFTNDRPEIPLGKL